MGWDKNDTWLRYQAGIEVNICLRIMCYVPSAVLGDESFELSFLHFYNCPTLDGYNGCENRVFILDCHTKCPLIRNLHRIN